MAESETGREGSAGFRVVDRRGRDEASGESDGARDASGGTQPAGAPREARDPAAASAASPAGESGPARELPPVDFGTLVISLSTSALHHLGLAPGPDGAPPGPPNLALARQTIDLLEVLQLKTRGNLDRDEDALLESLLYELRMRFVEKSR